MQFTSELYIYLCKVITMYSTDHILLITAEVM